MDLSVHPSHGGLRIRLECGRLYLSLRLFLNLHRFQWRHDRQAFGAGSVAFGFGIVSYLWRASE